LTQSKFHNELQMLIEEHVSCANYYCSLLKQLYNGHESFLRAKVLKLIPKEGLIENTFYRFHGSGCYFEYANLYIDIDFGPNNRCDGFDMFRLKNFLFTLKDQGKYKVLKDHSWFEQQFDQLVKANIIYNPKSEPSPHLYYLNNLA